MGKVCIQLDESIDLLAVDIILIEIAVRQDHAFYRTVRRYVGNKISIRIFNLRSGNVAVYFAICH